MYPRTDIKIPQPSMSKSHPSPKTTTTTTTTSTRRDATNPLSTPSPRPQTLQAPAPLKKEGTNTLMGQYQKATYGTSHTHQTPTVYNPASRSRKPQSQKPSAAEKPPYISRGAKGAGRTYSEGMTRARERGRSGRFGGDGDGEVGTSSLAVSCWEDEWGVGLGGIFGGGGREKRKGKRKRRRRGFCMEGKEAGGR